MSKFN